MEHKYKSFIQMVLQRLEMLAPYTAIAGLHRADQ